MGWQGAVTWITGVSRLLGAGGLVLNADTVPMLADYGSRRFFFGKKNFSSLADDNESMNTKRKYLAFDIETATTTEDGI